jgi:hypothetical protein
MFILTINGKEEEGAYSVQNDDGEQVLYLFEEEDDATRYAMMLEEEDFPEMNVLEVDDEMMIHICEAHGYEYSVITQNDIVIPPKIENHDFI